MSPFTFPHKQTPFYYHFITSSQVIWAWDLKKHLPRRMDRSNASSSQTKSLAVVMSWRKGPLPWSTGSWSSSRWGSPRLACSGWCGISLLLHTWSCQLFWHMWGILLDSLNEGWNFICYLMDWLTAILLTVYFYLFIYFFSDMLGGPLFDCFGTKVCLSLCRVNQEFCRQKRKTDLLAFWPHLCSRPHDTECM